MPKLAGGASGSAAIYTESMQPTHVIGVLDCGRVGRVDEDLREQIEDLLMAAVDRLTPKRLIYRNTFPNLLMKRQSLAA